MPHKVNPIDYENSEGNLGMANALLTFLSAIGLMGERHGAEGSDELAQNLLDMTLAGIGIDE